MKLLIAGFSILAAACANYAMATAVPIVWCDGCSDPQKNVKALSQPEGVVYIGDVIGRNLHAYDVWSDIDDSQTPPRRIKYADPIALAAPYQDAGNALIEFYNISPMGMQKNIGFNYPDPNTNVYSVAIAGARQNNLTDWVSNQPYAVSVELRDRLENVGSIFHIADGTRIPTIEFTITFTDGSRIDVKVDLSASNPHYTVVLNSGRDSHNNNVLSTVSPNPQQFGFSGPGNTNDFQNWLNQMNALGYVVGAGGRLDNWVCTMRGGGVKVTYACAK